MTARATLPVEHDAALRRARALADRLVAVASGTIDTVIFYGSRLHGAGPAETSAFDFVVVVDRYAAFYRAWHAAGALRRSAGALTILARVLPPNSIAFRASDGACAKCLVVSRAHLATALGRRRRDHLLLARLLQQVEVVHVRDQATAAWLEDQLALASDDVLDWLAPFLPPTFDVEVAARTMLDVCYRSELRPEADDRARVVFDRQRAFLCSRMKETLDAAVAARTVVAASEFGALRLARPAPGPRRLRTRAYFAWSNARITARWFKHVLTFDDWLPFIAAKVERRTGERVVLTARERRWPAIFLWPRVWRTLRTRPSHEWRDGSRVRQKEAVPVAGVRATLAFLRDPAAFTAGPGLALGDLYRVPVPRFRLHVLTDPQLAEEVLVRQHAAFEKSRIYWGELRRSFGASMGSLEGERWRLLHAQQRPYFTPRAVDRYLPTVEQLVNAQLERIVPRGDSAIEVRLMDVLAELNARVVIALLFGVSDEPAALEIARRIADGHATIVRNSRHPWGPRFTLRDRRGRAHAEYLRRYTSGLTASAAANDPRLLLHALVRLCETEAEHVLRDLVTNEFTFHVGASTETQTAAEAWTLHLLARHPAVLARLRAEIDAVTRGAHAATEHVPALGYCRCVVQEALRLYPPVHAILRDCVAPAELPGHLAEPGDSFLISVYGMHRNPRLWEEPLAFRPDRFAAGTSALPRLQYVPFGGGKHVCIGQHLAMPSMVLVTARFAQLFDWQFAREAKPGTDPTLRPAGTTIVTIRRRAAGKASP